MYFAEIDLGGNTSNTQMLHDPYSENRLLYKGQVTQVLGAINDFRFEILHNHPLYETEIRPYSTLVKVRDSQNKIIFRGRVVDYSQKMSNNGLMSKEYLAECELAYLLDSMQKAEEIFRIDEVEYLRRLLINHNATVGNDKKIHALRIQRDQNTIIPVDGGPNTICNCGATVGIYHVNYGSTYQNIRDQILTPLGGYIWLEYDQAGNRILNYSHTTGVTREMPIELAVNLESMKSEYFPSREITQLIPLGSEIDCPELAIDRLTEIGLIDNPDFWRHEVRYWDEEGNSQHQESHTPVSRWTSQLLVNLSKLNFNNGCKCERNSDGNGCIRCISYISAKREAIQPTGMIPDVNSIYYYERAVDFLANSGAINSQDYWKEAKNSKHLNLRWLIRLAAQTVYTDDSRRTDIDCPLDAIEWLRINNGCDDDPVRGIQFFGQPDDWIAEVNPDNPNRISPWTGQLIVKLARLNFNARTEEEVNVHRAMLLQYTNRNSLGQYVGALLPNGVPRQNVDCNIAFRRAVDSLSNTGVIGSPNYWKDLVGNRYEGVRLIKWLIRLGDLTIDHTRPLKMQYNDAIEWLTMIGLMDNPEFWREQIREPEEGEEDHRISPWTGRLLVELAMVNYRREYFEKYRTQLQPRPFPDINDTGAYKMAVDSLSNTGAFGSPEYWKEAQRVNQINLRWLIRLADFVVDHEHPHAEFPRRRLTIEKGPEGRNYLPVKNNLDTVVEGVVIWDDINDPEELYDKARQWVADRGRITNSISISALDLSHIDNTTYESFNVGDSYYVDNRLLEKTPGDGSGYPLIEKKIDVVSPLKSSLTFGDRQVTLGSPQGRR